MKAYAYTTLEDLRQHLASTVVLYRSQPHFVQGQGHNNDGSFYVSLVALPVENNRPFRVSINDPDLEPRGARLGYCNVGNVAYYLSRIPRRQFQQGLGSNNVNIPRDNGNRVTSFDRLLHEPGFADLLRNTYPTFQEAVQQLEAPDSTKFRIAFHRHFAIEHDDLGFVRLLFKGDAVGYGKADRYNLPQRYSYLAETLTENGVQLNVA